MKIPWKSILSDEHPRNSNKNTGQDNGTRHLVVLPPPLLCNIITQPLRQFKEWQWPAVQARGTRQELSSPGCPRGRSDLSRSLWSSITRGEWWWCHLTFYHKSVNKVKKAARKDESSLFLKSAKKRIKSLKWLTMITKKI